MNREDALLDEGVRPHGGKQFLLPKQAARVPHQSHKHVERLRRQCDAFTTLRELPLLDVELELAEPINLAAGRRAILSGT